MNDIDTDADILYALSIAKVICPRCEAGLGVPCRSISGHPVHTHVGRTRPVWEAYMLGLEAKQ